VTQRLAGVRLFGTQQLQHIPQGGALRRAGTDLYTSLIRTCTSARIREHNAGIVMEVRSTDIHVTNTEIYLDIYGM
jgi:hypothetical protein